MMGNRDAGCRKRRKRKRGCFHLPLLFFSAPSCILHPASGFPVKVAVPAIAALLAIAVIGRLPRDAVAPGIVSPAASLSPEVRLTHAKAAIASALAESRSIKDDDWKACELGNLAAAQTWAGDVEASRQTFAQALQIVQNNKDGRDSFTGLAFYSIACAQARSGDLSGGLQTARSITLDSAKADALERVAGSQAAARDLAASRQTLAEALQTVQGMDDQYQSLKDSGLRGIAIAQARAGDLSASFKTAKSIPDDSEAAFAMGSVAQAQAKAGDGADSRETFAEALRIARSIHDGHSKAYALESIAAAQAKAGDAAASRETFAQALQAAQSIRPDNLKPLVLGYLAAAQAKAGDVSGALRTAQKILDNCRKAQALGSIAAAQAKAGDAPASAQTFTQALDAARSIRSEGGKVEALSAIAAAQAEAGDLTASRQSFAQALEAAQGIEDAPYRAGAFDSIVTEQVKADVLGAEITVRTLPPGKDRCDTYIEIAEALLEGPHALGDEEP